MKMKNLNKKSIKYSISSIFIFAFIFSFLLIVNKIYAQATINIDISTSLGGHPDKKGEILWPRDPEYGGEIAIIYKATGGGVDHCSNPVTGMNGPSNYFNVGPTKTTVYTITCYNLDSSVTVSADIKVIITGVVLTKNTTDITDTQASLWAQVNPSEDGGWASVQSYFRYSATENHPPIFCNDIYGSDASATNDLMIWSNDSVDFFIRVGNLMPNTTYYYCVVSSGYNPINGTHKIKYGGVKSFTTKITPENNTNDPSGEDPQVSITTGDATVVDEKSAYIAGFYNTTTTAHTWFEYRKRSTDLTENDWSAKIKEETQKENTNGNLTFLLTGLDANTSYDFRAVIKNDFTSEIQSGDISAFTTKNTAGIGDDGTNNNNTNNNGNNGSPYTNPCKNTTTDTNCNGTGSGGTGNLPDLTVSIVTLPSTIVNTPINMYASILNQGGEPTSYVAPIPVKNNTNANDINTNKLNNVVPNSNLNPPTKVTPSVSFWLNLFKTNTAVAANTANGNNVVSNNNGSDLAPPASSTGNNTVGSMPKGSFYSFFQISKINPNKVGINEQKTNIFNSFFTTNKALAANTATGNVVVDNTSLINLPPILMAPLGAGTAISIAQTYTFPTIGTYYIRACADKKYPTDIGLISESNESNNCGPWNGIQIKNVTIEIPVDNNTNANNNNTNNNTNYNNSNNYNTNNSSTNPTNLSIGQTATAPNDAIVHYHEGIETVLQRQIVADSALAKSYGYQDGADLSAFAWNLADILAKTFGYVSSNGKEIRISKPDIAAYQLYMVDGILTVYEYYDSKLVNIQRMSDILRSNYSYEYYFKK